MSAFPLTNEANAVPPPAAWPPPITSAPYLSRLRLGFGLLVMSLVAGLIAGLMAFVMIRSDTASHPPPPVHIPAAIYVLSFFVFVFWSTAWVLIAARDSSQPVDSSPVARPILFASLLMVGAKEVAHALMPMPQPVVAESPQTSNALFWLLSALGWFASAAMFISSMFICLRIARRLRDAATAQRCVTLMWLLPAIIGATIIVELAVIAKTLAATTAILAQIRQPSNIAQATTMTELPSPWRFIAPMIIGYGATYLLYSHFAVRFWLRLNRASTAL